MLNNKKFNIVLSLIIAIGLWAYVIGETNPQASETFRDIPIQFINEDVLNEQDLAVRSVSADTVNVTLTGSRANIAKVDQKDITAVVNLADAASGENQLRIVFRVPDNVEIDDKSLNKVTVAVEQRISKELDIVPEYEGNFDSEKEPITVEMSRRKATVTGAESLVEQVDHIKAVVKSGKVADELKTISCELEPVDIDGAEVSHLDLSAKTVQVTAQLASLKTVELEVPVVDDGSADIERSVSAPKTITIKGRSEDLDGIEKITAETVDISDIISTTTAALTPVLPEGVQISKKSADSLYITVTVTRLASETFSFDAEDIELEGLDENLRAELRQGVKIEVTVKGSEEVLAAAEKADITLSVDLSGLEPGVHHVSLIAVSGRDGLYLEVNPAQIRVTIEEQES